MCQGKSVARTATTASVSDAASNPAAVAAPVAAPAAAALAVDAGDASVAIAEPAVPAHAAAAPHVCACSGHGAGSAEPLQPGRVAPASHDMDMPEVPFPSAQMLEVAGADGLRALVRRHHALLRDSEIGHLFAVDATEFFTLVERIADYVVEVCGGPARFTSVHGNTCMRTRHFPFTIDERARLVWLEKLFEAMQDCDFPESLHEPYWAWMEPFTVRMLNRRTTKAQPLRLPYGAARVDFIRRQQVRAVQS